MQLIDKDLMSIQETRQLIAAAKKAQHEFACKSQEEVNRIVKAVAEAGVKNAQRLGAMAQEETGFGIPAHKLIKNVFASRDVYEAIKDLKTVGEIERDDSRGLRAIAVPVGVIAGLIPSTNPTSTVLYKAEIALKAGNSIVFSPHPSALKCILETVKVIREAITAAGGDENLVNCISIPSMQATDTLMKHPDVKLILATGGSAMVRAAYSSGTPAIGVGPGNGPSFIDKTADLPLAVKRIMDSKTFDNGTICASEQSVICVTEMRPAVQAEMERQGAYFLNPEEKAKLSKFILRANGSMNPEIVGKSVKKIAERAGLSIPENIRVLVADEDGVGKGHPFSNEKLAPILGFFMEDSYEKVCDRCVEILYKEGAGHTFSMHTNDDKMVDYFSKRIPVSRFVVNTPSTLGGIGASTSLMPSLTLGCGAIGGSATSENVGPLQLMNIKYVAYGRKEMEDIVESMPKAGSACCGEIDAAMIESIVKSVIENFNK